MTTKHTPGPWNGPNFNGHYWDIFPNTESRGGNISVFRSGMTDEEVEANANLIASAPELLDALEYCIAMFDEGVPEYEWDSIKQNARAAIAKAKGEA